MMHVLNANTMAISTYTGLDLIDVVEMDGRVFACTATELYELTGSDDDGADIAVDVKTGKLTLGDPALKYVPRLYYSGAHDEGMEISVTSVEGGAEKTRLYSKGLRSGSLREGRVKLARRPHAVYWQFRIQNVSGGDLVIDRLDVLSNPIGRRV